ncbi:MAG: indole-3-glycerol phosphate synthase TrpC [Chloroflexota bacterium]|nr:indole-3-glycerol phosphate synthase TrpC [Chloroflexota bacterium]
MILDRILAHKRREIALLKEMISQERLARAAEAQPSALDLRAALHQPGVTLIAEVKRASPSKGPLRLDLDPAELALAYARGGAEAISVLTDGVFFRGSLGDLAAVKRGLTEEGYRLPILRKDFILDPYQVYEARAYGADAILLIAAALSALELAQLLALSRELGMEPLVEVHDEADLEKALPCGLRIIGVNNRDLRTFKVNLDTIPRLRPRIPQGTLLVSESGVQSPADVRWLAQVGVDAVLVGEALVTAADPADEARGLVAAGMVGEGDLSAKGMKGMLRREAARWSE